MNNRAIISAFFIALFIAGCEQRELPVAPFDRGGVHTGEANYGSPYKNQVWYDLASNAIVSQHSKTEWDLAFDCRENAAYVYLNSANGAVAAFVDGTDFHNLTSAEGLNFKADHPEGDPDSLAIGEKWLAHTGVYVIDRGFDERGRALGFRKAQFLEMKDDAYRFRYAQLDGKGDTVVTVEKDDAYNTVAYSFQTHRSLNIEPSKDAYDIVFTQYMHVFYSPYVPYLVTGVLINRNGVQVAREDSTAFASITAESLGKYSFSSKPNAIGYDWKFYDLNSGVYTTLSRITYIIRDRHGFYYKLRFVDFYDDTGASGAPRFEFQLL